MKNASFFLFFLLMGQSAFAQIGDRILISGTIEVPLGDDPQGIDILNLNSNKFTVTNSLGEYRIAVAVNDSLRISTLQFQEFTIIVNQGVIDSKTLNIYVSEMVSRLPEIVVTPYYLSGNIRVDLNRLKTVKLPSGLTAGERQNLDFGPESRPNLEFPPYNTAMAMSKTRLVNGINFVNIFKEILISNKEFGVKDPFRKTMPADIDVKVRNIYQDDFFRENLDIELEYITDFIYYADENGLSEHMLKKGNELDLIEFLVDQSKKYKKQHNRK